MFISVSYLIFCINFFYNLIWSDSSGQRPNENEACPKQIYLISDCQTLSLCCLEADVCFNSSLLDDCLDASNLPSNLSVCIPCYLTRNLMLFRVHSNSTSYGYKHALYRMLCHESNALAYSFKFIKIFLCLY